MVRELLSPTQQSAKSYPFIKVGISMHLDFCLVYVAQLLAHHKLAAENSYQRLHGCTYALHFMSCWLLSDKTDLSVPLIAALH